MQVHILRATGRVFAFTERDDGANLPARYGPWTAFKSIEMRRGEAQPGVDVEECLDDIDKYGFHLTDAHLRIDPEALGSGA
ncbi:MAG: hypothetical protein H7Y19_06605 [Luteimonas sp.]|nr:hypothetical protein [Luteimonas sp.]